MKRQISEGKRRTAPRIKVPRSGPVCSCPEVHSGERTCTGCTRRQSAKRSKLQRRQNPASLPYARRTFSESQEIPPTPSRQIRRRRRSILQFGILPGCVSETSYRCRCSCRSVSRGSFVLLFRARFRRGLNDGLEFYPGQGAVADE